MQRTPYLARKMGSALLSRVAAAVTSARSPRASASPDPAVRDAKFVAYVGHDTNIWNLAGMLDVTWLQPGYQRNQTPPTGALMFEVRERPTRSCASTRRYVAQSLEQMRTRAAHRERRRSRRRCGCPAAARSTPGFPCTLEEFAVAVRNSLDRDCVE